MSDDFVLVREAFAESVAGRALHIIGDRVQSAWQTSAAARVTVWITGRVAGMPAASRLATAAGAIAIASGLQPLLIALMPQTVTPALPWPAFVILAVFAAVIAWQPAPFVIAWRSSRLRNATARQASSRPTLPSREHTPQP